MQAETRKWLHVALFSLIVFLTLPFGPYIRDWLYDTFGKWFVIYFVAAVLLAGVVTTIVILYGRRRRLSLAQIVWFVIIGYLYWRALRRTFAIPIEAVHFVEYGILSILVYRAFRERYRESFVFLCSFLVTYAIGMTDELIQWMLPDRVGEFWDVLLNAVSGGLVQLLIWKGIRPEGLSKGFPARSFRTAMYLAAFAVLYTGIFISNVNDFGYLHRDRETGRFFSRLSIEELLERDETRWQEYARRLDDGYDERYVDFLARTKAPFLYEMRVHLFRRDRHFMKELYHSSCCEQAILRKYFGRTLEASRYRWEEEKEETCREKVRGCRRYKSPVSHELVVRYSETEMWVTASLLAGLFVYLGRRKSESA